MFTKGQCDRKDPACSQCRRVSKECPGYRDELNLLFRDENEKTLRKARGWKGITSEGQLARRDNACQWSNMSEKSNDGPDDDPSVGSSSVNNRHFNPTSAISGIHRYEVAKTRAKRNPRPKSAVRMRGLLPELSADPYISSKPSTAIFDHEEQPYFQLFCATTILELSGYFDSELWNRLILQACHHDPAVRKAVVAIAALSKTKEQAQVLMEGQVIVNEPWTAERHHQFALQRYGTAVRLMRDQLLVEKQNVRQALVWNLLIYCFETYHGDHETALRHAHTGLELLSDWLGTQPHSVSYLPGLNSPVHNIIEDELVQAFTRLDCEVMTTVDRRPEETHIRLKDFGAKAIENMPSKFSTLQEAKIYCDLITQRVLHFLSLAHERAEPDQDHEPHVLFSSPESIPRAMVKEKERLLKEILLWNIAFEPIFKNSRISAGQKDLMGATVLQAHAKVFFVGLQAYFGIPREMAHDNYTSIFAEVLTLTKTVIEQWDQKKPFTGARFSSDLGIVFYLFWVALRCRDRKIRHQAIRLLQQSRCREGIWDSSLSAKAAAWVVKVEEVGLEGDYIPLESRVHITSINCLLSHWQEMTGIKQWSLDIKLAKVHCESLKIAKY